MLTLTVSSVEGGVKAKRDFVRGAVGQANGAGNRGRARRRPTPGDARHHIEEREIQVIRVAGQEVVKSIADRAAAAPDGVSATAAYHRPGAGPPSRWPHSRAGQSRPRGRSVRSTSNGPRKPTKVGTEALLERCKLAHGAVGIDHGERLRVCA